jgi:microbial collagenase
VIVTITDGQSGNTLTNGEAVTVSGAQDSETIYQLDVPQNATSLVFNINSGSGDADLYVKYGAEPTRNDFDCRPYRTGNSETCEVTDIKAGTYYVMLRGYNSFNGVSLTGTYETSDGNVPNACSTQSPITSGTLQDGLVECLGSQDTIWLSLGNVSGQNSVAISTGNGSGDLKIEYSNSGWPSGNNVDAVSDNTGNNECIYVTGQSQYWGYLKVSGQASNASIVVDYNASGCR